MGQSSFSQASIALAGEGYWDWLMVNGGMRDVASAGYL